MANRSGRSWLVAGILGALVGMYIMDRLDGMPMQRRMKFARRRWMRSLSDGLHTGRNMLSDRFAMLRR
ncbi:MAG TPA: hypothetical protein GX739_02460 [Firmicutes bacterium]|nr:hypothetical protein [Bacillota bacterium]